MMNYKIGLEIHIQLKTKTKLFSHSPNVLSTSFPNSAISSYDLAYPGTLPQVNLEAVKLAIQACYLFKTKINSQLQFDRKHYYYYDLPKGFQITQFFHPLGKDGHFTILLSDKKIKSIPISSIHLEEDTAKTVFQDDKLLLDYNRCGLPLIEIVTEPVFQNYQEVKLFLEKMIRLFQRTGISLANFSLGTMRVDLNFSSSVDGLHFSPRSEIKNLNSFNNIKNALQAEMIFQKTHFADLQVSYTKTYQEKTKTNQILRKKFSRYDYYFIRENNIAPIALSSEMIVNLQKEVVAFYDWEENLYSNPALSFLEIEWLLKKFQLLPVFWQLSEEKIFSTKTIFLFLKEILVPKWKTTPQTWFQFNFSFLLKLLQKFEKKEFSFKLVKILFEKYGYQKVVDFNQILPQQATQPTLSVSNQKLIIQFCQQLLLKEPQLITLFLDKPQRVTNYIFGLVKKEFVFPFSPREVIKLIQTTIAQKQNKK